MYSCTRNVLSCSCCWRVSKQTSHVHRCIQVSHYSKLQVSLVDVCLSDRTEPLCTGCVWGGAKTSRNTTIVGVWESVSCSNNCFNTILCTLCLATNNEAIIVFPWTWHVLSEDTERCEPSDLPLTGADTSQDHFRYFLFLIVSWILQFNGRLMSVNKLFSPAAIVIMRINTPLLSALSALTLHHIHIHQRWGAKCCD